MNVKIWVSLRVLRVFASSREKENRTRPDGCDPVRNGLTRRREAAKERRDECDEARRRVARPCRDTKGRGEFSVRKRSGWLMYLPMEPRFETLPEDARFRALLAIIAPDERSRPRQRCTRSRQPAP